MEWWLALTVLFGALIVLLLTGLPVAFCFMLINLVGVYFYWGGMAGFGNLINSMFSSITFFALVPVAMFILMGEVIFQSGIFVKALDVLDQWMGKLPGRLGLLAVGASTMFSTLSGSSMGTTAMLGSLLTPEMEARGYKKPMSLGPILGAGGLAMIIPPSALAVVLATLAEISVGQLLMAGIFPGLLMATLYTTYIIGRCTIQPDLAPSYTPTHKPLSERLTMTAKHVLPFGVIILVVIVAIFTGIASPTEASAMGAFACFILAAAYGKLNFNMTREAVMGTIRITVMMFIILTGSTAFSQILAISGATQGLVRVVSGFQVAPIVLLISMQLLIMILGCFMEQVSIMMITFPIFMPLVNVLEFDPIWFGLLVLINMEIGMTSPPFGFSLFVMKGVAPKDTTMVDIYLAALPFILCDVVAMAVIMAFPPIATWLPTLMMRG